MTQTVTAIPGPALFPAVHINPPAAVTTALHQLQAACGAWAPTTTAPPGTDTWTPEAMVCSLSTGPGFLRWTETVVVGTVIATILCLGIAWGLWKIVRGLWGMVAMAIEITREHRARRHAEIEAKQREAS